MTREEREGQALEAIWEAYGLLFNLGEDTLAEALAEIGHRLQAAQEARRQEEYQARVDAMLGE